MSMSEYTPQRLKSAIIKADQLKATGVKVVVTSCHNCVDGLTDVIRHYKLGMKVTQLVNLTANALVIPERVVVTVEFTQKSVNLFYRRGCQPKKEVLPCDMLPDDTRPEKVAQITHFNAVCLAGCKHGRDGSSLAVIVPQIVDDLPLLLRQSVWQLPLTGHNLGKAIIPIARRIPEIPTRSVYIWI